MLKVVGASWMQIRLSTWIIGIVLVFGIVIVILGQMGELEEDGNYSATAYWNDETGFEIKFWGQGLNMKQIPKGVAKIYFQPHIDTTGWAIIDIETQSDYPDWVQAYAAGMLEGSISWQFIYWHWKNTVQTICENQTLFCNYVKKYLDENYFSVKKLYENTDDPYWHQIYLFYVQLEGMHQGFDHGVKRSRQTIEELEFVDFLLMNAASDAVDLESKFYDSKPYGGDVNYTFAENFYSDSLLIKKLRNLRSVESFSSENHHSEEKKIPVSQISCGLTLGSALVKFIPDDEKLFIAHNSAGPYVSMLRMIKNYNLRYHWSATNFWVLENKLTFSSYPSAIHSMDDFYIITKNGQKTKMVLAGTPITVFNTNLWKLVSPLRQVLSGVRVIAASRLSANGSDWAKYFSKYNSGTGNKQWLIVDVENFKNLSKSNENKNETVESKFANASNILWVAEQLPGHFEVADQTKILTSRTYWASFGLPFYKNISEMSGVTEVQEVYGDAFSYDNSPLAKIYRRDHSKATTITSITTLMRSNSFRKDPLSLGNPRCAIGARGDIPNEVSYSFPIGVIDSKIFLISGKMTNETGNLTHATSQNDKWLKDGTILRVVAGPAHSLREIPGKTDFETNYASNNNENVGEEKAVDDDILKPFNWQESLFRGFPHNGHPNNWDFDPICLSL